MEMNGKMLFIDKVAIIFSLHEHTKEFHCIINYGEKSLAVYMNGVKLAQRIRYTLLSHTTAYFL